MTSPDEIERLAARRDIIALGMMADEVRRRRHGARTTFVRVASVPVDTPDQGWPPAAGEIRIAGAPSSREQAVACVRSIVRRAGGIPVSGFALSDLERCSREEGITLRALLEELSAEGLELVAEADVDLLQDPRRSIEQVNIAGLALARLTVARLPSGDTASFYRRIADLQRSVGVIRAFAPLPRHVNPAVPTTGYDDVTRVALARLIIDNVPSIQVDWSLYGPKLAQVALTLGADDVDAVSAEEGAAAGRRRTPLEEIRRNIRAAGLEPLERNGRFELLDARVH